MVKISIKLYSERAQDADSPSTADNRSSYSLRNWLFHLDRLWDEHDYCSPGTDHPDVSALIDTLLRYPEAWLRNLKCLSYVKTFRSDLTATAYRRIHKESPSADEKYEPIKGQLLRAMKKIEVSII
jgi:hypothetical protein